MIILAYVAGDLAVHKNLDTSLVYIAGLGYHMRHIYDF